MKTKLLSLFLVAASVVALVPTAANAERHRWRDGVWRTNSVYVRTNPNRRYRPYFQNRRWHSYNPNTGRWHKYRHMESRRGGYWFY